MLPSLDILCKLFVNVKLVFKKYLTMKHSKKIYLDL